MNRQYNGRMFLERMSIQRFRSLYDVSLTFGKINIFIGSNNSGKSNLFALFRFLHMTADPNSYKYRQQGGDLVWRGAGSEDSADEFHATLCLRYGDEKLFYEIAVNRDLRIVEEVLKATRDIETVFINRHETQLEFRTHRGETKSVAISSHRLSLSVLSEPALLEECAPEIGKVTEFIRGWRLVDDANPQAVKKSLSAPVYPDRLSDKVPLKPDGENIAEFLCALERYSPDDFALIQERLSAAIMEKIETSDIETPSGTAITYRFREFSPAFSVSYSPETEPDSVARVLFILALLLGDKSHSLVCMEEPDRNLSPELMLHIADAMRYHEVLKEPYSQIFVITHHPLFLNCFNPIEESEYLRVFVAERETGKTKFRQLNPEKFAWWLGKYPLGELFERRIVQVIGRDAS